GRRRGYPVLGLSHAQADVTDRDRLSWWVGEFRARVVIDCAAFTAVDACEEERARAFAVNDEGAGHAASAAAERGAHLLHVSTDYVFDGRADEPYAEQAPTAPLSVYGESKLRGEERVLEYDRGTVVRTSWLFGPGGPSFVATMLRLIGAGTDPLRVVDDQVGCPTFTVYVARALWDLAELGAGPQTTGVIHYRNREPVSWYGFASEIVRSVAPGVGVVPVTTDEFPRPARRPAYSVLAVDRFEEIVGRPVETWRAALQQYLDRGRARQVKLRPRPTKAGMRTGRE
ncbi:MAG: dTDP-4-dehydrorhamnose reductase, partial [Acidobacteriota bacterium]